MAAPKIRLPAILLAHDLLDGDVLVRAAGGWSRDPRDAFVAATAEDAARLEAEGAAAFAAQAVVEPTLVEATIDAAGRATPDHFRERFKLRGPSHRRDLGKQAEFAGA